MSLTSRTSTGRLFDSLVAVLNALGDYRVRLAIPPNPQLHVAEDSYFLVPGIVRAKQDTGAGRWGYKVQRDFEVHVRTVCYLDAAGEDAEAVVRHLDAEDAAINALHDWHPSQLPNKGISVKYSTSTPPSRMSEEDTGTLTSVLTFNVLYPIQMDTYAST